MIYKVYSFGIVGFFIYLTITGNSFFNYSKKRTWTHRGAKNYYFHK